MYVFIHKGSSNACFYTTASCKSLIFKLNKPFNKKMGNQVYLFIYIISHYSGVYPVNFMCYVSITIDLNNSCFQVFNWFCDFQILTGIRLGFWRVAFAGGSQFDPSPNLYISRRSYLISIDLSTIVKNVFKKADIICCLKSPKLMNINEKS